MNLYQLYYFQSIAKHENFHRAAQELHISQPSLSNAISKLEKELGVILFERTYHQTKLTKYGEKFLTQISPALKQIDDAVLYMKKISNKKQGHIDIAYIPPLPPDFIPNCVRNYLEEHTDYHVTFSFSQAPTIYLINALREKMFDVIFCTYHPENTDIEYYPIIEQPLVGIVPSSHPLASREEISIEELQPYDFIMYAQTSGIYPSLTAYFQKVGFHPNIKYETSSEESITSLVSNGLGVSCVMRTSALNHWDIHILRITPTWSRTICMAYRKGNYLIPSVQSFIDYMKSIYASSASCPKQSNPYFKF